jgi:hypothetical protein
MILEVLNRSRLLDASIVLDDLWHQLPNTIQAAFFTNQRLDHPFAEEVQVSDRGVGMRRDEELDIDEFPVVVRDQSVAPVIGVDGAIVDSECK